MLVHGFQETLDVLVLIAVEALDVRLCVLGAGGVGMDATAGGVGFDDVDFGVGLDPRGQLEGVVLTRVPRRRAMLFIAGTVVTAHGCVGMGIRLQL